MMIQATTSAPVFLKDPHSTELGKAILRNSILLLDELGLEAFTFRKLALDIGATEPSIYRYFENKQRLLLYLTDWYWSWLEYRILREMADLPEATQRLDHCLDLLSSSITYDPSYDYIDESVLYRVVVSESSKVFLNKQVDQDQQAGFSKAYERITVLLAQLIHQIQPEYPFAQTLASTLIETAHIQQHFAAHIPELTECGEQDRCSGVQVFLKDMVSRLLH
jgi:AcrR family transcriptional regulator